MKRSYSIFLATFLLATAACHVDNSKVVETENQTLSCLPGEWKPETEDPEMSTLIFTGSADSKSGTVTAKGALETMQGNWSYAEVGKVNLTNTDGLSTFQLLNCDKGIINGETIYVRSK